MIKQSRQILPDQMYDNDSDQSSGFCSDASSYHLTSEYLRRIEQLFLENRLSKDFFCAYRTNKKRTTSNKKTSTNKKTLDIKHKAERHWFEVETDEEAFDVKVWSSYASADLTLIQQRLRSSSSEFTVTRPRLLAVNSTGSAGSGGSAHLPVGACANSSGTSPVGGASTNGNSQDGIDFRDVPSPVSGNQNNMPSSINSLLDAQGDLGTLKDRTLDKHEGGLTLRHVSNVTIDDLIQLGGPLTEDSLVKTLQARFSFHKYFTNIGPILLAINNYLDIGNALTLASTREVVAPPPLQRVVQEAIRQQSETGYPQAIILSGCSGSGKTYSSMLLLRQLFDLAGGGPETDAFKHLSAAFTVLRSLGSSKTVANSESSRIGHFIEVQVTNGELYRTKIHCYFLDQTRVVKPLPQEKNYHIFYQMLAGLTSEERVRLKLEGYNLHNLKYLNQGDLKQNEVEDAKRFQAWKACLGVLGIPSQDVLRVLAVVLLLGNIRFSEHRTSDSGCSSSDPEIQSVASLLGIGSDLLFRGLTTRTHSLRGQLVKSMCDANMSRVTRDALAKALYCRTVATIVRRANSLKRVPMSGTLSSDSNDSVHNQMEIASQHASTVGTAGSKSSRSMAVLNHAVRHATDGFIGILDMFGFEDAKPAQLEHLCLNLCAETMQHFYNTHIFKSSLESCREEGIAYEAEIGYVDNVPCIDLISSLRTGLLSMLDVECQTRGTAESYVQKAKTQHKANNRLLNSKSSLARMFAIQHFAGKVDYDASDFLDTNRDVLPDDLVSVFHKNSCQFGFATHLFASELKALYNGEPAPRGIRFRISPTSHTELVNGDEPISTLTQDFHTRLDNLLRTLVHAKPHFVRCMRANSNESVEFDSKTVAPQLRALQVLETVGLMSSGFPHRMRFKAFNSRYRLLAPFKRLKRSEDSALDDCQLILEGFKTAMPALPPLGHATTSWSLGKRHIFLSEAARQQLETLRTETRHRAAILIQSHYRGYISRKVWRRQLDIRLEAMRSRFLPLKSSLLQPTNQRQQLSRPRPQPIACTPPPEALIQANSERFDLKSVQQLFGIDKERPPPVPPARGYTVAGNTKLGYPQTRVMKNSYPEDGSSEVILTKGEIVLVLGSSSRRGMLVVEHKGRTIDVPYQFLELRPVPPQPPSGVDI